MRKKKKITNFKIRKLIKRESNQIHGTNLPTNSRNKINQRKIEVKRRKNFFLSLLLIIFFWSLLGALIFLFDPQTKGAIPIFFLLSFITFTFMFSFVFINTKRGLVTGLAITIFLLLRYLGVGNVVNLVLIVALSIIVDILSKNSS